MAVAAEVLNLAMKFLKVCIRRQCNSGGVFYLRFLFPARRERDKKQEEAETV